MTPSRIKEIEELIEGLDGNSSQWAPLMREASTALRQLLEERRWKPIESAPKDRDILLCDSKTADAYAVATFDIGTDGAKGMPLWMTADGAGYRLDAFDYWRELPSPPEEGEGK